MRTSFSPKPSNGAMRSLIGALVLDSPIRRDPEVVKAVRESREVLARNYALVKELAAVERALRQKQWKKQQPASG